MSALNIALNVMEIDELTKLRAENAKLKAELASLKEKEPRDMGEVLLIDAFRDALGRMHKRGGEEWFDGIPITAVLTLGDVRKVRQGLKIRVVEPQDYSNLADLTVDHFMMSSNDAYGFFYGIHGDTFEEPKACSTDWDHMEAVSGSGADGWLKICPELIEHAKRWH